MDYHYETKSGVCSRAIDLTLEDGVITSVRFQGGCDGNSKGIARLAVGMKAEDVVKQLRGIKCGFKDSSCPDQLSYALEEALDRVPQKGEKCCPTIEKI